MANFRAEFEKTKYRENKSLQTCHEASPQAIKMNTSLETEMKENYETRSFSGPSCLKGY